MEPMWTHQNFSMWSENVPKKVINPDTRLVSADQQIDQLGKDARKALWESDGLKLARDVAMISRMFNDITKNDQARRLHKICHLRQQNVIGAGIVTNFMNQQCAFVSGNQKDLEAALHKVWKIPKKFFFL